MRIQRHFQVIQNKRKIKTLFLCYFLFELYPEMFNIKSLNKHNKGLDRHKLVGLDLS